MKATIRATLITFLLLLSQMPLFTQNQVTFIITSTPLNTPKTDSLYLVTSTENWVTDPQKKFKLFPDGNYRLTISMGKTTSFDYKINRGNWNTPEGNRWGSYLENRKFTYRDSIYEVKLKVESWQDLNKTRTIHTVLTSVPENTPADADIYITGNFNGWSANDLNYKLQKDANGTYSLDLHTSLDTIYFKFTRGAWSSVEARWDGGMQSNRVFLPKQTSEKILINDIKAWSDLSQEVVWLNASFIFLFIQSLILLGFVVRNYTIKPLIILFCVLATAFLVKFFIEVLPHLRFVPVICYPFISALMYASFWVSITKEPIRLNYTYLLPFLPLLWFAKFLTLPQHEFYLKVANNELMYFFFGSYSYAMALHLFFSYKLGGIINKRIANIPETTFQFYRIAQANWYASAVLLVVSAIALWQKVEIKLIADWLDNLLWLGIGGVMVNFQWIYITGLHSRDIIKSDKGAEIPETSTHDRWVSLKPKLTSLMETKALYTNPGLKLSDIASHLGTNNHYVSRLINEGFNQSFTDYINKYRIEAFIESMQTNKENTTILYHAFKVGFNSKSSFNRAFKSVTNMTPNDYFAKTK